MKCHKRESDIRGKNTCEAPEIAAAMSLQVHRRSEELRFSKIAGLPYEHNARANKQRRTKVKAMGVEQRAAPSEEAKPFYIVQERSAMTNAVGF
jgi:hypothetical protein